MKKTILSLIFIAISAFPNGNKTMTVYKSPYCECCENWINIMKTKGFDIKVYQTNNMNEIKKKAGLQAGQTSCHTAFVDGYFIEGHVDYSAIKKMLAEKPDILGISAPGMPLGSPGMEQDNIKQHYNIIYAKKDGSQGIYEKH
ncbi:DUF411 domain-containing protein [Arcobacter sp. KX21116]|uniref:DUF411 domain-containing protein n=1 Tax=Arcobacter iocasae TaxID=2906515 RepID=UPI0035D46407